MDASEKFWNKVAARFAERPVADTEAYSAKLAATQALLKPDDVVLDVGCGTGSLALELAAYVSEVHASDLSREMIRIAERRAADQQVRNVTFHHTSIADLSFGSGTFDAVTAYNVLHLVDDRSAALATIFGLLKPGGVFVSSTACLGDSRVPFRLVLPIMKWVGRAPPVQVFGIRALNADLRAAGFVDITEQKVSSDETNAFLLAAKPRT
jgi:arsenite methyltransferase